MKERMGTGGTRVVSVVSSPLLQHQYDPCGIRHVGAAGKKQQCIRRIDGAGLWCSHMHAGALAGGQGRASSKGEQDRRREVRRQAGHSGTALTPRTTAALGRPLGTTTARSCTRKEMKGEKHKRGLPRVG